MKNLIAKWFLSCPTVNSNKGIPSVDKKALENIKQDSYSSTEINIAKILYEGLNDNQKRIFIRGMKVGFNIDMHQLASMLDVKPVELLRLFIGDN